MKAGKLLSIAIISALLAACSSGGGGGGNGIRPSNPSGPASLNSVPQQHQSAVSTAKTINLSDNSGGTIYQATLDGKTGTYNFSNLPNGQSNLSINSSEQNSQGQTTNYSGTMLVYQQPYSVVTGVTLTGGSGPEFETDDVGVFFSDEVLGFATPLAARAKLIAENAIFEYKGVAFDGKEEGTLNYTMLFGQRMGHGSITGFARTGAIKLWPAQLTNDGFIRGDALLEGVPSNKQDTKYELSFFGPNAEELAGYVYDDLNGNFLGDSEIIFAGTGKNILAP